MRRRCDCGRMSPTRCVAADVWPLTWQSKQATPCMPAGFSVLRSAVALNCCCGNCVTSRRMPSRSLAFRMPCEDLLEVVDRHHLALRDVAQVGPRGQEDGRRELGQEVLGQVEIDVEALQAGQQLDLHLREDHAARPRAWGAAAAGSPWGTGPSRGSRRETSRPASPRSSPPAASRPGRPGSACRATCVTLVSGRGGQVVALLQQLLLAGHDRRLVGLVLGHHWPGRSPGPAARGRSGRSSSCRTAPARFVGSSAQPAASLGGISEGVTRKTRAAGTASHGSQRRIRS